MAQGRSGLLHATTGAGKTYAVWLGALQAFADGETKRPVATVHPARNAINREATPRTASLTVLWITPMRALAADTLRALSAPLQALAIQHAGLARWSLGARTGDTGSAERSAQARRLPTVLVTTPESLSLLLARFAGWNPSADGLGHVGHAGQPARGHADVAGPRCARMGGGGAQER